MGLDKITTKFQESLQSAQQLASKSAHAELKSLHVLLSLLNQDGGIVTPILEKAGVDVTSPAVIESACNLMNQTITEMESLLKDIY